MEIPDPTSSTQPQSAEAMLDQLIKLLVDPNAEAKAWLQMFTVRGTSEDNRIAKVNKMIRLGAVANVDPALITRVTAILTQVEKLAWSSQRIEGLITAIYKDWQLQVERERKAPRGSSSE